MYERSETKGKLGGGIDKEQFISPPEPKLRKCYYCLKNIVHTVNIQCKNCKSVYYCDKTCQKNGWPHHETLCKTIHTLHENKIRKVYNTGSYNTNLSVKRSTEIAKLVGEKCIATCKLNQQPADVLLDTGAQVSIINKAYLQNKFPNLLIQHMKEIIDEPDSLRVQWGSSHDIPFDGWVNLTVTCGSTDHSSSLDVPFLVTTENIPDPILGFNAIKQLMKSTNGDNKLLLKIFESSLNK